MNRQTLADMFGIDTHVKDVERLNNEKMSLTEEVALLKAKCDKYESELAFYRSTDEVKVRIMMQDAKELEETYKKRIEEFDKLSAECDRMIDEMDRAIHREFARGRVAAYSELGIWNIDAHKRGNSLAILENGEVVEVICDDLVDVQADVGKMTIPDDEIVIDDLVDIA